MCAFGGLDFQFAFVVGNDFAGILVDIRTRLSSVKTFHTYQ
jgi:hypothetical protein